MWCCFQPDREDERRRIEGCGGRIIFSDGARVEGILAMSRAIGISYSILHFISDYSRTLACFGIMN